MTRLLYCMLLMLLLGAGCKSPTPPMPMDAVFYPPAPETARLQYLTSFDKPEAFEPPASSFLTYVAGSLPPKQGLVKPYGLCLKNNQLLVCDTVAGMIHELDLAARQWSYFRPDGPGAMRKVINVDVDEAGNRYVADPLRGQILVYDAQSEFVAAIGREFELKPTAVRVKRGRIYVTDLKLRQIHVYDAASRNRILSIPAADAPEEAQLFGPTNLDVDADGRIYVSDSNAFRVQIYDAKGALLRSIGRQGDTPGSFARNKGVAVDPEGRIYVVDAAFQNAQIFDAEGKLLLHFGDFSKVGQGAMVLPAGILINDQHNALFQSYVAPGYDLQYIVLVANQYGPHKINVYGFVQKQ
jgi:hypothetical protein